MSQPLRNVLSVICIGVLLTVVLLDVQAAPNTLNWPEDPSTNIEICTMPFDQSLGMSVSDGAGGAIVVWEDYRNADTISAVYAQRIDATGNTLWSSGGISLGSSGSDQIFPVGISDGNNGAIFVWMENEITGGQLVAQRVNGAGELLWPSNGIQFTSTPTQRWSPNACPDGQGGIIITWYEAQGDSSYDILAQKLDSLGNVMWNPGAIWVCGATNSQVEPQAAPDGNGGAIILWTDFRFGSFQSYCQRIDAAGYASWQADGISICPSSDYQYAPLITASHDGGAVIVWHDFFINPSSPSGFESDILSQRIDSLGNILWDPAGLAICTAADYQYRPTIVMDTNGGAFIAWYDFRSGSSSDIYGQYISSTGLISWQIDGILICGAANSQQRPLLLEDGINGAIIVWEDMRASSNIDLYWQRIDIDGNINLQIDGLPVTTAMNDQFNARLVGTSAAGAIVVWEDKRTGYRTDLYGDRILIPNSAATWGLWVGTRSGYNQAYPLYVGVHPTALDGLDPADVHIPSISGGEEPLVWSELNEGIGTETLIQDMRQDASILGYRAQRWLVNCSLTSEDASTTVLFAPDRIPSGLGAVIYGPDSGQVRKIETTPILVFPPEIPGPVVKNLQVLIGDSVQPTVQVISPNGGEVLIIGLERTIQWNVSDSSGIFKQYIYFEPFPGQPSILIDSVDGLTNSYLWIPLDPSFAAKINIIAIDSVLNSATDSSDSYFTIISGDSLTYTLEYTWNLISLPLEQLDMSPGAVFGDDFAPLAPVIYEFSPALSTYVIPSNLELGFGYWLYATSPPQSVDIAGSPVGNVTDSLEEGWNIIGDPFPASFNINSIRFIQGSDEKSFAEAVTAGWIANALYSYDGITYYQESVHLEPWHGYWLLVQAAGISINYDITLAKSGLLANTNREIDQEEKWTAKINASLCTDQRTVSDKLAVFGSASKATPDYDNSYDIPRPPRTPDNLFVELSFIAESKSNKRLESFNLSQDIRDLNADRWPFAVTTSHSGLVTLSWDAEQLRSIKRLRSCLLRDLTTGAQVDMFVQSTYSYDQTLQKYSFEIQAVNTLENDILPKEYQLQQCYPNPFNPSTTISFSLPSKGFVSLKVYDLMGREVAVLIDKELPAGTYKHVFNAHNYSSGIYFYRLQTNRFTDTKKLTLIK